MSIRIDNPAYESLTCFCDKSGQPKTVAIERAINKYINDYELNVLVRQTIAELQEVGMNTNSDNPKVGKTFEELVRKSLGEYFDTEFNLEVPIPRGTPAKDHRFDCVSADEKIVVECKCYSWNESGNNPSAKIRRLNEAVFYMNFLPEDKVKIICMAKALHSRKSESLAEYYHRIDGHLLGNVKLFELDESGNITIIRD